MTMKDAQHISTTNISNLIVKNNSFAGIRSLFTDKKISSNVSQNNNTSDIMSDILDLYDTIKTGDYVRIVGKDPLKGQIGLVEGYYTSKSNNTIYKIQLQATGDTVDRHKNNLKKHYLI